MSFSIVCTDRQTSLSTSSFCLSLALSLWYSNCHSELLAPPSNPFRSCGHANNSLLIASQLPLSLPYPFFSSLLLPPSLPPSILLPSSLHPPLPSPLSVPACLCVCMHKFPTFHFNYKSATACRKYSTTKPTGTMSDGDTGTTSVISGPYRLVQLYREEALSSSQRCSYSACPCSINFNLPIIPQLLIVRHFPQLLQSKTKSPQPLPILHHCAMGAV